MSKDLSARYYQQKKEKIQRKSRERFFWKRTQQKATIMVANDIEICDKMTSNGYMSIEKDITKCEKRRFKLSIHLNEPKK